MSSTSLLERAGVGDHRPTHGKLKQTGTDPSVLIVEDDHDCGHGLSLLLRHWGYRAAVEHDGAKVLARIDAEEPAIVLLDLGLPGMHGLKLLHQIRMMSVAPKVIVVTASTSQGIAARAEAMGAVRVLGKPIDNVELQWLLDDLVHW